MTTRWQMHPEGMAAFSSRGPTQESRFKPDVIAPGTSILSTHSPERARPVPDLRIVPRPGLLLRLRHEHGHAAGRRLRGGPT